jgi:serine/threonine-protein kinase
LKQDEDPGATLPADTTSVEPPDARVTARAGVGGVRPPPGAGGPTPGTVLGGKYRIERVLGTGGIAVVAEAYHLQLRCKVAIKYLLAEALEYPEIVERFSREARAAARIRGEHVARVIDVGVFDDGAPFIVLEYLEGIDLQALLAEKGPLPVKEAVRYILETCEALAEAHAAKIVHRDLKPANLFVAKGPDRRRRIKVLDFGVSKIVDEPMTDPARILGTVVYMSPEQLRTSSAVDARSDIWALGVILYELLAGRPPFLGRTVVTVAQRIGTNLPESLIDFRSDLPRELDKVIRRCMSTDPAERPSSVLELAKALAPFADSRAKDSVRTITGVLYGSLAPPGLDSGTVDLPVPTVPPVVPPPVASDAPITTPIQVTHADAFPPLRSRGVVWLAAAASIVVLALAGHRLVRGGEPSERGRGEASSPSAPRASPAASSTSPAAASDIKMTVTTTTKNARVRIDDGPLRELPIEARVARDEREHTIRLEADGYIPRTKIVRFDTDLHVGVSLTPVSDASRPEDHAP